VFMLVARQHRVSTHSVHRASVIGWIVSQRVQSTAALWLALSSNLFHVYFVTFCLGSSSPVQTPSLVVWLSLSLISLPVIRRSVYRVTLKVVSFIARSSLVTANTDLYVLTLHVSNHRCTWADDEKPLFLVKPTQKANPENPLWT